METENGISREDELDSELVSDDIPVLGDRTPDAFEICQRPWLLDVPDPVDFKHELLKAR